MTHKNVNEQAWKDIHAAARAEFPNPLDDPRRKQPGRAWFKKKNGFIQPSSRETDAACKASLLATELLIAHNAVITENLKRHANDKARRHIAIESDTYAKHAEETARRHAKHLARRKNPNRFDLPITLLFIFLCCLFLYLVPVLTSVK